MTRLVLDAVSYQPGREALFDDVSLSFEGHGLVALVGPNGAGKSSLLRLLAGLVEPAHGRVAHDGHALADLADRDRAQAVAYLPPDGRAAWPIEVRRLVALGRIPHLKPLRSLTDADRAAVDEALAKTEVAHLADRRFDTLSSGEQSRVLLARTLCVGAGIILLDGPAAALARLAKLDREHGILGKDIVAIDLRLDDRLIVKLGPDAADAMSIATEPKQGQKS